MNKRDYNTEDKKVSERRKRTLSFLLLGAFLLLSLLFAALLFPLIKELSIGENLEKLRKLVESRGFLGWLLLLGVQTLQIIVALLPGEPVELALGVLLGALLGTVTCLFGIFLGTLAVLLLVRRFGLPLVRRAIGEEKIRKYTRPLFGKNRDYIVFLLFFIPGTPKDVLTYLVPLSDMPTGKYLLISTLARLPSVITSTVLGGSLLLENIAYTALVLSITLFISIVGFFVGRRIVREGKTGE